MKMPNDYRESSNDGRLYPAHARVGVGAVVRRGNSVLLVKRAKEPARGKWSVPGGMLEIGETLAGAAEREVLEECGIRIKAGDVFGVAETITRDDVGRVKYHFVIIDLSATYVSGEIQAASDAADCRWVPLDELQDYDMPESLRDSFRKKGFLRETGE